jgi:hypothetical protein
MSKKNARTKPPLPENERKDIRIVTELDTIVNGFDENNDPWKEFNTIENVSIRGAGFTLNRPVPTGRLVKLTVSMPRELRVYDEDEQLYTVVGLVQYCQPAFGRVPGMYDLGVAFIGKEFPDSYNNDPGQSYRISGANPNGMWTITELRTEFKDRSATRFRTQVPVTISLIKRDRTDGTYRQETVTRDIGAGGACVECALDVKIGDRIKFASKQHNFYAIAVVRNRARRHGRIVLHIEFLEHKFPVMKLEPIVTLVDEGESLPG